MSKKVTLREKLLRQGKKAIERATLPHKVKKDKNKLEAWILEREEEVSKLEIKILNLKAEDSLDVEGLLDAEDALEIAKDKVVRGKRIFDELFETKIELDDTEEA